MQAENSLDQMDWIEKITSVIASLLSSQPPEKVNKKIFLFINFIAEICVSIVIVMDIPIICRVCVLHLWEAILMALPARVILIVIRIHLRKSTVIIIYVNLEVCNSTSTV